jgi:uncharacterized membrane protein
MSQNVPTPPSDQQITDNDKLMALLSYVIWVIVPLIVLLSETGKQRPFQKYHAVQSLVLAVALLIIDFIVICPLSLILGALTLGIGSICSAIIPLLLWALSIYYGIKAYQGEYVTIPVVTDFARNQKWL